MSFLPRLGKKIEWEAHGAVAVDHDCAFYHIPFFGEVLGKSTRRIPLGLAIVQSTPFFRVGILLQWQRQPGVGHDWTEQVGDG